MGIALRTFFARESDTYIQGKERIDKCYHCGEISKQSNNVSFLQKSDEFVCMNCWTMSHANPCPCGHCETHPYNKTGLTEKDITK